LIIIKIYEQILTSVHSKPDPIRFNISCATPKNFKDKEKRLVKLLTEKKLKKKKKNKNSKKKSSKNLKKSSNNQNIISDKKKT